MHGSRVLVVVAALVAPLSPSCVCNYNFERLQNAPPGSVTGRTIDAGSAAAIAFSKVGVDSTPRIVRSLSDGTFSVRGLSAGNWLLRMASDQDGDGAAERSAIRALAITRVTTPDGKQQLSSVLLGDVGLDGTATLLGTVKDQAGAPAAGVRVVVFRNSTDLDADQNAGVNGFQVDLGAEQETATDSQGSYRLPGVSRGVVHVAAALADGTLASAAVNASAQPGKVVVVDDITLSPGTTRPAQVDILNPPAGGTVRVDVVRHGGVRSNAGDVLV
ncbi:MAG TPA: carboxypeptidase-like regulatory domain-containing protein, partial [Myxococcota bacterium]